MGFGTPFVRKLCVRIPSLLLRFSLPKTEKAIYFAYNPDEYRVYFHGFKTFHTIFPLKFLFLGDVLLMPPFGTCALRCMLPAERMMAAYNADEPIAAGHVRLVAFTVSCAGLERVRRFNSTVPSARQVGCSDT